MTTSSKNTPSTGSEPTRRQLLLGSLGAAAVGSSLTQPVMAEESGVVYGNIQQSIVWWCFGVFGEKWSVEKTAIIAKKLGCKSVELVGPKDWAALKKHDITCAIASNGIEGPPFVKGLCNASYHQLVTDSTNKMVDAAADFGCPNVIAFTGMRWNDAEDPKSGEIPLEKGIKNCVEGLKKLARQAEKKKVTICLEHLNSRVTGDDSRGHPGYFGDQVDVCIDILKQVGSERVKLLFDIYHVQIMDGDLVKRIRDCGDMIGHVHTAGNPGRRELDDQQEIQYPILMKTLLDIGYKGYVGQEFIPNGDPETTLAAAVRLCDV